MMVDGMILPDDARFMARALDLARQGLGQTHPNPSVGAVVVQNGQIVGEGFTQPGGRPHAEAVALTVAGSRAQGATLYVTLEPCSHTHNRDGSPRLSCASRCIEAGIRRVVCAVEDPDTRVVGQGFGLLRDAGVAVTVGVEQRAAQFLDPAYFYHRAHGLPYITHKTAMTLDGKIAAPGGHSRWITGDAARAHVHLLRDATDALIVGVGTVLADDPSLTTRLSEAQERQLGRNGRDPIRVIIDSRLRTPPGAKVARVGTLFLTTPAAPEEKVRRLREAGADVLQVAEQDGRVDVRDAVRRLAERGIVAALLESGGTLAASFYQAHLVRQAIYFVAPKIIGGGDAPTPVDGAGLSRDMGQAVRLCNTTVQTFGVDFAISGEVCDGETDTVIEKGAAAFLTKQ